MNVSILIVVPAKIALDLCNKKVVKDYNTLPQINKTVIETIRGYMSDRVGYSDLPMACLSNSKGLSGNIADNLVGLLPVNSKESVLFQLEMPDDMIINIQYSRLLDLSTAADNAVSPEDLEFIRDDVRDSLSLGAPASGENTLVFIPFLDLRRCKFYARVNEEFGADELNLPGIEKCDIREISSFITN